MHILTRGRLLMTPVCNVTADKLVNTASFLFLFFVLTIGKIWKELLEALFLEELGLFLMVPCSMKLAFVRIQGLCFPISTGNSGRGEFFYNYF